MKKPKSVRDLVRAALRKAWLFSSIRSGVVKGAKHPTKTGWWKCALCEEYREKVQVDHRIAVGPLNEDLSNLLDWTKRLFYGEQRPLCRDCHKEKTKDDIKKMRAKGTK